MKDYSVVVFGEGTIKIDFRNQPLGVTLVMSPEEAESLSRILADAVRISREGK